jgi:hypothetical protein
MLGVERWPGYRKPIDEVLLKIPGELRRLEWRAAVYFAIRGGRVDVMERLQWRLAHLSHLECSSFSFVAFPSRLDEAIHLSRKSGCTPLECWSFDDRGRFSTLVTHVQHDLAQQGQVFFEQLSRAVAVTPVFVVGTCLYPRMWSLPWHSILSLNPTLRVTVDTFVGEAFYSGNEWTENVWRVRDLETFCAGRFDMLRSMAVCEGSE